MKQTSVRDPDELLPEYRFDYSLARPNRFAEYIQQGSVAVVLEPDVAAVFHDAASVNRLLRSVIAALPKSAPVLLDEVAQLPTEYEPGAARSETKRRG
jgi:hypothetical protein